MIYLFDPLTGMTRMVGPSGEGKSFRYDSFGKLNETVSPLHNLAIVRGSWYLTVVFNIL